MNKMLKEKIRESVSSVAPITLIVFVLCVTIVPMSTEMLSLFMVGAVLLVVGMGFFTLGADMAMMRIGESIGNSLTRSGKAVLVIICCFIIGVIITLAEPDLQVLADQTPAVPSLVLMLTVATGVGVFLATAFMRILLNLSLSKMLLIFYGIVFILAAFVPRDFLAVAFDAGGVTTGPITVPFIMSLGLGLTALKAGEGAEDDSFGLVALSSIGPIMAVLVLGLLFKQESGSYTPVLIPEIDSTRTLMLLFSKQLPEYAKEVLTALLPIFIFFLIFKFTVLKISRKNFIKILIGMLYTFIGLTLFLTGVNVGFMPVGNFMGELISGLDYRWILIPIGMLIGYFIVKAEPAVHVLNKQVEDITGGAVSQKTMMACLSVGMSVSVGLAMLRVLTGISLMWMLIPGYTIALALSFAVPKLFTAIAFDSGGVASGPMTATFLLPFAMGACSGLGGNVTTDAFGIVAMVAMTPLVTIQILGLYYGIKTRKSNVVSVSAEIDGDIIFFEEVYDE